MSTPSIYLDCNNKLIEFHWHEVPVVCWYSYTTLVAFRYKDDIFMLKNTFSRTTARHLNTIVKDNRHGRGYTWHDDLTEKEFEAAWEKVSKLILYGDRKPRWLAKREDEIRAELAKTITADRNADQLRKLNGEIYDAFRKHAWDDVRESLKEDVEQQIRQEHATAQAELAAKEAEQELRQYYRTLKKSDVITHRNASRVVRQTQAAQ